MPFWRQFLLHTILYMSSPEFFSDAGRAVLAGTGASEEDLSPSQGDGAETPPAGQPDPPSPVLEENVDKVDAEEDPTDKDEDITGDEANHGDTGGTVDGQLCIEDAVREDTIEDETN